MMRVQNIEREIIIMYSFGVSVVVNSINIIALLYVRAEYNIERKNCISAYMIGRNRSHYT